MNLRLLNHSFFLLQAFMFLFVFNIFYFCNNVNRTYASIHWTNNTNSVWYWFCRLTHRGVEKKNLRWTIKLQTLEESLILLISLEILFFWTSSRLHKQSGMKRVFSALSLIYILFILPWFMMCVSANFLLVYFIFHLFCNLYLHLFFLSFCQTALDGVICQKC